MQDLKFKKHTITNSYQREEKDYVFKMMSLEIKLLKNINTNTSFIMSVLYIIAWLLFIFFVCYLYFQLH